ncbi:Ketol-acid reductoisomerase [Candidatus Annandia adelgestsuga]|uniref:Ketol-acid reductoisomerase (NADP(+)) n=1 Tax=Candidatus Annandia adelgestsuga TaxID=1302411 RepID=A0A3S9J7F9_9ENTR|nr:ketol-acid reductoisomerase [Candidatus Annandia adelgestsuga]AZP36189.1 Ketol-acid reductoisomerase [Candidatus Annandia adelgestsuga]
MSNYFNELNFRKKLNNLKKCRFMKSKEFLSKCKLIKNKKIVIIGCGAQGLNQGLNMRDSGLNISYALKKESIINKNISWKRATENNFLVDNYEKLIPNADLVINLTPDKQHSKIIKLIQPLMKKNSILGYSHGFNIVEIGEKIRNDITVIMVAPKCPGTEVREEYKKGFGVPTLIAVHPENDPLKNGIEYAKSWAYAIGSHKAGVLESSFIAEVKSDLMGEQTILCGLLQTSSILLYEKLIKNGFNKGFSCKLIQYGWEKITESLKYGGITLMMDRLSNYAKIRAYKLSIKLKNILKPLFKQHMDNIISGSFSKNMIKDWKNKDKNLLKWRKRTNFCKFEKAPLYKKNISEQEFFDRGLIMVSLIKAGVELSFEIMTETGILPESAYYESLHELPLIANTIARKRLYEMNLVISDTAEYGNYLFFNKAVIYLREFINKLNKFDIGLKRKESLKINNLELLNINNIIRNHKIEKIGIKLRNYMNNTKLKFSK